MTSPSKSHASLAIETSGHASSIAIGKNGQLLASAAIAQRRHAVDLLPTIAHLFSEHALQPANLTHIYISIGPGSFTGLRIGITAAKFLARTTGAQCVAVPTIDALALGLSQHPSDQLPPFVAIMLNIKNDTGWGNLYEKTPSGFQPRLTSGLWTLTGLRQSAPGPVGLVCEALPESIEAAQDPVSALANLGITRLPESLTLSSANAIWTLGESLASQNQFTDPLHLAPLYAREPEAVTLWNSRHGS